MTSDCLRCGTPTAELSALLDDELPAESRRQIETQACPECATLLGDLRAVRGAVSVAAAVAASSEVDSGWSRTDGAVFLAAFRDRLRGDRSGEDLWRWLAVRLWPVSAGLMLGALLALGNAAESEGSVDLEGQTLAFESAQAEIEPDLLGEMLAPQTRPGTSDAGSEP